MFKSNTYRVLVLLALMALALGGLPFAGVGHAATAAAPKFEANCSLFHLAILVSGTFDDGGGLDRFRYLITDGNGKKLYLEDATRRINETKGSNVANFSFNNDGVDGAPEKNPIQFYLIDVDVNNNMVSILQQASYNASCLAPQASPNPTADYIPPRFLKAVFVATTELYQEPGRGGIGLQVQAGKEHYAVYRSADYQWVAVDVSGEQLVWVPASTVQVDISRLNIPPTRIDGNDPSVLVAPTPVVPPATVPAPILRTPPFIDPGVVVAYATINTTLRLRAGPSLRSAILTLIPPETLVPVYGRNGARNFVKVTYQGLVGWVSVGFITLVDAEVAELPVVQ